MTSKTRKPTYQTFIISDVSTTDPWRLMKQWLRIKIHLPGKPYCNTRVRRAAKGGLEVTFELPPSVRRQMHQAIKAGRQIRLYAP